MDAHLRSLLRDIEPTPTQKRGAQRSHRHLRELLDSGHMERRLAGSYLSGSYSRGTAIYPLDDVDIIFVIDPTHWQTGLLGQLVRPSPAKVLESFARALRLRYPETAVHTQRRSVRLALAHLDIDCVPAIEEKPGSEFILVPDRVDGGWVRSSPSRHKAVAIEVNERNKRLLKPLVKLLKCWNASLPETARVRSFLVETIAVTLFRRESIESLSDGLLKFFDFLADHAGQAKAHSWKRSYGVSLNWWNSNVPDVAGTGTNVAAGLDGERRRKFLERAVTSRNDLLMAREARTQAVALRHVDAALRIGA